MQEAPRVSLSLAPAAVEVLPLEGGGQILRSPMPLRPYPDSVAQHLRRWAGEAPDRTFLAERAADGAWRRISYAEALGAARAIGQSLLDRDLSLERPVMVLSGNGVDHGLLQLGCLYAGVPIVPLSQAYSLVSKDHAKLKFLYDLVHPGLLYAADGPAFARALGALDLEGVELSVSSEAPDGYTATPFAQLLGTAPTPAVDAAFDAVGPDTVAKILFTSGSTDKPKGVINTHRMLCSNQQTIAQVWPFLEEKPPVFLDWLPWNHTFGGNHNFNMALRNGGTLYIDAGKPVPGQIQTTVANLREVSPTIFFNVPRGYDVLLPFLEADEEVRDAFFRDLDMIFYAAAALPQNLWERLEKLSVAARGQKVLMVSSWGATETSPLITAVHYPIERAGVIGLPAPGNEVKLVPNAGKLEMRVRGPNVTPGYFKRPDLTAAAFDEEGFYCIGDAGKLEDPDHPERGLVFDGRVTEDFKLVTGTWVHANGIRLAALDAGAPLLQDVVVTGHNRDYLGVLAWPDLDECRKLVGDDAAGPETLVTSPAVLGHLRRLFQERAGGGQASSTRIARILLMAEPPDIDASEITDKGYINQRATLERRAALVEKLYSEPPPDDVIVL